MQAIAKIVGKPRNGTFVEGTDVVLTCIVEEENTNIIWRDEVEDIKIFINRRNYTKEDKYQNFNISTAYGNYSLIIKDAQKSDEGIYSCREMDTSYIATVTIEGNLGYSS